MPSPSAQSSVAAVTLLAVSSTMVCGYFSNESCSISWSASSQQAHAHSNQSWPASERVSAGSRTALQCAWQCTIACWTLQTCRLCMSAPPACHELLRLPPCFGLCTCTMYSWSCSTAPSGLCCLCMLPHSARSVRLRCMQHIRSRSTCADWMCRIARVERHVDNGWSHSHPQ